MGSCGGRWGGTAWGRLELRLCALPALPQAVYQKADLEVLWLECVVEVKLSAKVVQMGVLSELQLYCCPATMEPMALAFLQERLRGLHVQFTDITKIPSWLYSLKNLRQLHLSSHLCSNVLALEALLELRSLEILLLQTKLTKLPCSMSTHLRHLCIQNDGTKLEALGGPEEDKHPPAAGAALLPAGEDPTDGLARNRPAEAGSAFQWHPQP